MDELSTKTPSKMIKGCEEPLIDVVPLNLKDIPPPGAPEFARISAPLNLPYKAPSTVD